MRIPMIEIKNNQIKNLFKRLEELGIQIEPTKKVKENLLKLSTETLGFLNNELLKPLEEKKISEEEKINKEFSKMIRERMTSKQFWEWVGSWKDAESTCEQAEEWNLEIKRAELKKLKETYE